MKTRYIPDNANEIKRDGVDAVVYAFELANGKLCATGYIGKQSKHAFNYSYRSVEQRTAHINKWLDERAGVQAFKQQRQTEQKEYHHTYKVGDIVYFSWGYDQTNVDWFQVVAVPSPKTVKVQPIKGALAENNAAGMCGQSIPCPDQFKGEPMLKHVRKGDSITFASYGYASKWDGKPMYCSWYA